MRKRKFDTPKNESYGNDYWISFSDMMTGLMLIIILISGIIIYFLYQENQVYQDIKKQGHVTKQQYQECQNALINCQLKVNKIDSYILEIQKLKEENQKLKNANLYVASILQENKELKETIEQLENKFSEPIIVIHKILEEIQQKLKQKGLIVEIDKDTMSIQVRNMIIQFAQGSYDIPKNANKKLNTMSKVIYEVLEKYRINDQLKFVDTIIIEGHTDPKPYFNKQLDGNWGLSTMRAIRFWKHLKSVENAPLDNFRNHENQKLFSVSGYADSRPYKCSNSMPLQDRYRANCPQLTEKQSDDKDRRIDIRFTPKLISK
jgi:flagellar motor protein MotB